MKEPKMLPELHLRCPCDNKMTIQQHKTIHVDKLNVWTKKRYQIGCELIEFSSSDDIDYQLTLRDINAQSIKGLKIANWGLQDGSDHDFYM